MKILNRFSDILIWLSAAGLLIVASLFCYYLGGEAFLQWKYSKSMSGYFSIEIVNETDKNYEVHLINNHDGEVIESTSVDAMGSATIISRASEEVYKIVFIDGEQQTVEQEIYIYSLPYDRRQIRIMRDGEIQVQIVKNNASDLAEFQKRISEMN